MSNLDWNQNARLNICTQDRLHQYHDNEYKKISTACTKKDNHVENYSKRTLHSDNHEMTGPLLNCSSYSEKCIISYLKTITS